MSLELILGPMFAGKSSAIIGMIRRHAFIQRKTLCVTSALDTRYSKDVKIITHDKESYPAISTEKLMDLLLLHSFHVAECVIIEEAQFFPDLFEFVMYAVEVTKKQVVCVGLDGDTQRKPFGQLLDLVPYADTVEKYSALCAGCHDGTKGIFTSRRSGDNSVQISVGGVEQYEPLCRKHYLEYNKQ